MVRTKAHDRNTDPYETCLPTINLLSVAVAQGLIRSDTWKTSEIMPTLVHLELVEPLPPSAISWASTWLSYGNEVRSLGKESTRRSYWLGPLNYTIHIQYIQFMCLWCYFQSLEVHTMLSSCDLMKCTRWSAHDEMHTMKCTRCSWWSAHDAEQLWVKDFIKVTVTTSGRLEPVGLPSAFPVERPNQSTTVPHALCRLWLLFYRLRPSDLGNCKRDYSILKRLEQLLYMQ